MTEKKALIKFYFHGKELLERKKRIKRWNYGFFFDRV